MTARVLIHVQHLMGIGHQSRAALIARALDRAGAEVTYVSGGFPVPGLDLGGADFVQLPPARAADSRYRGLVDEGLRPVGASWKRDRRERLLRVLHERRPRVVVTETFPFGRRLLRFELLPLIEHAAARSPPCLLVSSVRDIVERRSKPARERETLELVRSRYHLVLVHSDPEVVPFGASFPFAAQIADRLHYTGYVARQVEPGQGKAGRDEILVSAGGGRVGEALLEAAIAARARSAHSARAWRVLVGPDLPEAGLRRLRETAPRGVRVEHNRRDFPHLLARCRASISQAGYNTVVDILRAGTRAVLVPYAEAQEREQQVRAALLAERGIAQVLAPDRLSPDRLAAALDAASERPRPAPLRIDLDGVRRSAERLAQIASGP